MFEFFYYLISYLVAYLKILMPFLRSKIGTIQPNIYKNTEGGKSLCARLASIVLCWNSLVIMSLDALMSGYIFGTKSNTCVDGTSVVMTGTGFVVELLYGVNGVNRHSRIRRDWNHVSFHGIAVDWLWFLQTGWIFNLLTIWIRASRMTLSSSCWHWSSESSSQKQLRWNSWFELLCRNLTGSAGFRNAARGITDPLQLTA